MCKPKKVYRKFPDGPLPGARVRSLVRELGSCKLCGMTPPPKKKIEAYISLSLLFWVGKKVDNKLNKMYRC